MVHTQIKSMTSPRAIPANSPIYSQQRSGGWMKASVKDAATASEASSLCTACLLLRTKPPRDARYKKTPPINGQKPFNFTSTSSSLPLSPIFSLCYILNKSFNGSLS